MKGPTSNMELARDYLRRWELRPYWRKQKRLQRARAKGGCVTRAKSVRQPKAVSKIESPVVKLAKLLHESGRKAVETGNVVNKVPGQPFYTWDELTPEAKAGRVLMAKYLLDLRRRKSLQGIFASA